MKKVNLTGICFIVLLTMYACAPEVRTATSASQTTTATTATNAALAGQATTANSGDLNQYAGKYKFEGLPFEYLTITVIDGKLHANTGAEEGDLIPLPETDTFDASGRAILKFKRDTDKKVIGMTLDADGSSFEGKKEA